MVIPVPPCVIRTKLRCRCQVGEAKARFERRERHGGIEERAMFALGYGN